MFIWKKSGNLSYAPRISEHVYLFTLIRKLYIIIIIKKKKITFACSWICCTRKCQYLILHHSHETQFSNVSSCCIFIFRFASEEYCAIHPGISESLQRGLTQVQTLKPKSFNKFSMRLKSGYPSKHERASMTSGCWLFLTVHDLWGRTLSSKVLVD